LAVRVKTDVLYKISNKQIVFKIGTVAHEKIEESKKVFMKVYRIKLKDCKWRR